jgi:hypothetical protein
VIPATQARLLCSAQVLLESTLLAQRAAVHKTPMPWFAALLVRADPSTMHVT